MSHVLGIISSCSGGFLLLSQVHFKEVRSELEPGLEPGLKLDAGIPCQSLTNCITLPASLYASQNSHKRLFKPAGIMFIYFYFFLSFMCLHWLKAIL